MFTSYAQNWEDVLLHRCFAAQDIGFYIDVGAYHPVDGNVTKTFYDRGWNGINVEPGSIFDTLAAARPRDVNLRLLVLDRSGEVGFVETISDRGMSHVANAAETPTARLPCDTLERIVRLHSGDRPIDFLKVDAEGSEIAIVRSTDWRLLRPTVMVFEATLPWTNTLCNQEWEPILLAQGYARTYFDGINCFYVAEEACSRLAHCFETPVNVLDRVERYNAAIPAEVPGEPGPYPTGTLLGLAKRAFGLLAR